MTETPMMFKGISPCGCVTLLYSGRHRTPKQREKDVAEVIRDGLVLEPLWTEEECRRANREWGQCPHQRPTMTVKASLERARVLLEGER